MIARLKAPSNRVTVADTAVARSAPPPMATAIASVIRSESELAYSRPTSAASCGVLVRLPLWARAIPLSPTWRYDG